ncbi:PRC-barrel domain-containing protein [Niallia taxi]|uniref:PRC-barrel domain-containing protein n=1 Tax=Niallia taxi TaxID=2499688 RepID=UPI0011A7283C|nr:PRC-barrel domain-containing protein [Niallia taxi]MCT2343130.1 PRC-barrel domain-containing protein [Niallia taxi]MED3962204.1 PRC-barrel domain-containing protein [Niallia taxi]WOD64167.1 PRC-barrel domain-containing protein [Niallia taxi]
MKNSAQIKGLPIISISNGQQEGKVHSLIINPEKGSVDFLTIEQEEWQESVDAIPFKKVVGVGEYAVTIESAHAIMDLNEIPIATELVNKQIGIIGANVITRKGELIGKVTEFLVDDDNGGEIKALLADVKNEEVLIDAELVMTYGKDIIVVKEEASASLKEAAPKEEAYAQETVVEAEELIEELSASSLKDMEEAERLQALKEKQVELLLNKKVVNDIYTNEGQLLLAKGTVLSLEDIENAQLAGPSVVIELSMNVEA